MNSRDIEVGAILELHLSDGRRVQMEITEIRDGRVTFKKISNRNATGRWWLDYQYVKQIGRKVRV